MKKIVLLKIVFILFCALSTQKSYSQIDSISSYCWSVQINDTTMNKTRIIEQYTYSENKVKHNYLKIDFDKKVKKKTGRNYVFSKNENVDKAVQDFIKDNTRDVIMIALSDEDKDTLLAMSKILLDGQYLLHNVDSNLLKSHIENIDSFAFDTDVFNQEFTSFFPNINFVLYPTSFNLSLNISKLNNLTYGFNYEGDIYGIVVDSSAIDFIIMYKLINKHNIFEKSDISIYFSKENLNMLILRYIYLYEHKRKLDVYMNGYY